MPLVAGLLLATLAGYVGWTMGSAEADVGGGAAAGEYAPILTDFKMPSLDERTIGPRDFAGQVVVVDFWATWCGPCRVQAKILEPLWTEMQGEGVQFLAVSLGESKDTVAKYVADHPYSYPVLYDSEDRIATEAEIYALPTVMVIDHAGKVSYFQPGLSDSAAIRQAVQRARAS
jgi:peroxiredoxin